MSAGRQVGLLPEVFMTMLRRMDNMNRPSCDLPEMPIIVVVILVCAIGAIIGLLNVICYSCFKCIPFIATMGITIIVYGINSLYYDAGTHHL